MPIYCEEAKQQKQKAEGLIRKFNPAVDPYILGKLKKDQYTKLTV